MQLPPGRVLDTTTLDVPVEAVPAGQVLAGAPATGAVELGTVGGVELGVWEMTAGGMRDVETDEVFVVVAGRAEVVVEGEDGDGQPLRLVPGTVGRLRAGTRTRWSVTEPLRKVYLLGR